MKRMFVVSAMSLTVLAAVGFLLKQRSVQDRLADSPAQKSDANLDIVALLGVSSSGAPNNILYEWGRHSLYDHDDNYKAWPKDARIDVVNGTFDASDCKIDEVFIEAIKVATEIEWLCLGPQATVEDLEWIGEMSWLRGLSLWGADFSNGDLSTLENLSALEWLDLSEATFAPQTRELPRLPKLEVLILRYTKLQDQFVFGHDQFPGLRVLDRSGSEMTDADVQRIAEVFPRLRCLNLYGQARITPKSVDALIELQKLQLLDVGDSGLIGERHTSGGRATIHLEKKLPKCFVSTSS